MNYNIFYKMKFSQILIFIILAILCMSTTTLSKKIKKVKTSGFGGNFIAFIQGFADALSGGSILKCLEESVDPSIEGITTEGSIAIFQNTET
jgi:hypothetical protein